MAAPSGVNRGSIGQRSMLVAWRWSSPVSRSTTARSMWTGASGRAGVPRRYGEPTAIGRERRTAAEPVVARERPPLAGLWSMTTMSSPASPTSSRRQVVAIAPPSGRMANSGSGRAAPVGPVRSLASPSGASASAGSRQRTAEPRAGPGSGPNGAAGRTRTGGPARRRPCEPCRVRRPRGSRRRGGGGRPAARPCPSHGRRRTR